MKLSFDNTHSWKYTFHSCSRNWNSKYNYNNSIKKIGKLLIFLSLSVIDTIQKYLTIFEAQMLKLHYAHNVKVPFSIVIFFMICEVL